jgi:hypothetical protein
MLRSSVKFISGRFAFVVLIAGCIPANAQQQPQVTLANQYCISCHNTKLKTGGLALDAILSDGVSQHPQEWEKVIRKLRGHYMPPPGSPRPDDQTYTTVVSSLVKELDSGSPAEPWPHWFRPPIDANGIPECHPRSAGSRSRCHSTAAGG